MKEELQISKSVLLLYMLIVIMCIGSWLLFWRSTWPPSILQIGAAVIGTLLGCLYCLDRIRNWDVRTWEWRDGQRRNRTYAPILYRILPLSGAVGVVVAIFIDRTLGKEVGRAFIPLVGTSVGLIFVSGTIEAIRHIRYHRVRK
jgi:hypothetical protein